MFEVLFETGLFARCLSYKGTEAEKLHFVKMKVRLKSC